jgi:hypothetical protein
VRRGEDLQACVPQEGLGGVVVFTPSTRFFFSSAQAKDNATMHCIPPLSTIPHPRLGFGCGRTSRGPGCTTGLPLLAESLCVDSMCGQG